MRKLFARKPSAHPPVQPVATSFDLPPLDFSAQVALALHGHTEETSAPAEGDPNLKHVLVMDERHELAPHVRHDLLTRNLIGYCDGCSGDGVAIYHPMIPVEENPEAIERIEAQIEAALGSSVQ